MRINNCHWCLCWRQPGFNLFALWVRAQVGQGRGAIGTGSRVIVSSQRYCLTLALALKLKFQAATELYLLSVWPWALSICYGYFQRRSLLYSSLVLFVAVKPKGYLSRTRSVIIITLGMPQSRTQDRYRANIGQNFRNEHRKKNNYSPSDPIAIAHLNLRHAISRDTLTLQRFCCIGFGHDKVVSSFGFCFFFSCFKRLYE